MSRTVTLHHGPGDVATVPMYWAIADRITWFATHVGVNDNDVIRPASAPQLPQDRRNPHPGTHTAPKRQTANTHG